MIDIDSDSRMDKIRALIAKAEGTHFPEEAKVFMAKAEELMAKWAIDEVMLAASKGKLDDGTIGLSSIFIPANEYRGPKVSLLVVIADCHRCKLVIYPQQYVEKGGVRKRMVELKVTGYEIDRKFVDTLFTSLLMQSEIEFIHPDVQLRMQSETDNSGHCIAWRNAFMRGYVAIINKRMKEARAMAEEQAKMQYAGNSMAMVLVSKQALVERKYTEFFPQLGKSAHSNAGYSDRGSAYESGRQAASKADLGSPKVRQSGSSGQLKG